MLALQFVLMALVVSSFAAVYHQTLFQTASTNSSCNISGPESCSYSQAPGSCCYEAPGGLLAQTQFWDFSPSTGPSDSWTIHGLWPDHCDGTYDSNCDPSRNYKSVTNLLKNQNASETLSFMQTYWVDINGNDESFWEHEWSKHGTCYSTFQPDCLQGTHPTGAEAVAYFKSTVKLFQSLPTYKWLANAGIKPDSSATYTLDQITSALKAVTGVTPALDCSGSSLNQIYWYFHLRGSGIDGVFVPVDAPKKGTCSSSGLRYPPKSDTTTTSTGTVASSTTTTAPTGLPTSGTIVALVDGVEKGGLLTMGTWSRQTLAKYTYSGTKDDFTIATSKGPCAVLKGALTCGRHVTEGIFSAVTSGSHLILAYEGTTCWSSKRTPSGMIQEIVYTGSSYAVTYTLAIV